MAKDPAFLFYPGDWLGGTMGMSFEEKGAYLELLVMQWNCHRITNDAAKRLVGEPLWHKISHKFEADGNGFFNERLEQEIIKRRKHSEKQRDNANKRWVKQVCDGNTTTMPLEDENVNKSVLEEIGSEKIKEIANEVWKDQIWKEQICMGLSVTMDELKKWLAQFNSSIASDAIPGFDKGKYKKMSRGWITAQKNKGVVVETGLQKNSSAPTLTHLKPI